MGKKPLAVAGISNVTGLFTNGDIYLVLSDSSLVQPAKSLMIVKGTRSIVHQSHTFLLYLLVASYVVHYPVNITSFLSISQTKTCQRPKI